MAWIVASLLLRSGNSLFRSAAFPTASRASRRSYLCPTWKRGDCWRRFHNPSEKASSKRMASTDHSLGMSVASFLKNVKQTVEDNNRSFAAPPHLVLGNPAGDADSIISAIGLAYIDSIAGEGASGTIIPIVSIPAEDLKSQRPETTYLLTKCAGLDPSLDDLLAIDQLSLLPEKATLTLVDHNHHFRIQSSEQSWTVTEIVDHHQDEQQHLKTCPPGPKRNIAFEGSQALVASTCTLVLERFYNLAGDNDIAMPPSLAILLLGVILLDSINMLPRAGKGTPRDGAAIQTLLEKTDWKKISLPKEILSSDNKTPDPTKMFECLQAQKFSPEFWAGLTALQGIRLDYKSFPVPSYNSPGKTSSLGIATILQDMQTFWKKDDVVSTLASFADENDLELLGLMFTFMESGDDGDDKRPRRQLALASTSKELLGDLMGFLNKEAKNDVDLELMTSLGMIEEEVSLGDKTSKVYVAKMDQGNSAASRKQVAPILSNFWKIRGGGTCHVSEVSNARQVDKISGRCLCGDIHFSITSKIGQILLCHCSQCRRNSGSPYIPYVALQRQALMRSIHSDGVNNQWGTIELSKVAKRNFCKKCGSLICMDYHAPNTVWVPLGVLDGDNMSSPLNVDEWVDVERDSQIFTEDKVPWMNQLQSLPLMTSFGTYKADVCGDVPFECLPSWQDDT